MLLHFSILDSFFTELVFFETYIPQKWSVRKLIDNLYRKRKNSVYLIKENIPSVVARKFWFQAFSSYK